MPRYYLNEFWLISIIHKRTNISEIWIEKQRFPKQENEFDYNPYMYRYWWIDLRLSRNWIVLTIMSPVITLVIRCDPWLHSAICYRIVAPALRQSYYCLKTNERTMTDMDEFALYQTTTKHKTIKPLPGPWHVDYFIQMSIFTFTNSFCWIAFFALNKVKCRWW